MKRPLRVTRAWSGARGGALALLILTPTIARAQEENVLYLFLVFPVVVVLGILTIRVWTWKASRGAKVRAFLAVAATTAALSAANTVGGIFPRVVRLGFGAFVLGIAVQLGLPALVWWLCRRREERRGEAQIADRQQFRGW